MTPQQQAWADAKLGTTMRHQFSGQPGRAISYQEGARQRGVHFALDTGAQRYVQYPQALQAQRRPPYTSRAHAAHAKHHSRRRSTFLQWCQWCQQEQRQALPTAHVDGRQFSRDPNDPTTWLAEASTLGLRPGQWPERLVASMPAHGMEPPMDEEFFRLDTRLAGDELVAVVYATRLRSAYLHVLND